MQFCDLEKRKMIGDHLPALCITDKFPLNHQHVDWDVPSDL